MYKYKWFIHSSLVLEGYSEYDILMTKDEDEDAAWDIAFENYAYPLAESYFSVVDSYENDIYESEGKVWGEHYINDEDIHCYIETYNPEKHDKYFARGTEAYPYYGGR